MNFEWKNFSEGLLVPFLDLAMKKTLEYFSEFLAILRTLEMIVPLGVEFQIFFFQILGPSNEMHRKF